MDRAVGNYYNDKQMFSSLRFGSEFVMYLTAFTPNARGVSIATIFESLQTVSGDVTVQVY